MSDCNVCIGMDYGDYEQPEFYQANTVKARKPHKCGECNREIPKGALCESVAGKWDGDFSTHRTCMDCVNIRDGLSCGMGFMFGELWNDIREIQKDLTTGCLTKVQTASAKAYLMERISKWRMPQ